MAPHTHGTELRGHGEHKTSMQAVEWKGNPYSVTVKKTIPKPTIRARQDAIVRLTSAAICGSDLHIYHGRLPTRPPLTLGHENLGIVVDVAEGVFKTKVGDRVLVFASISCGFCDNCENGLPSFCETISAPGEGAIYGVDLQGKEFEGGQAEYIRVPFADENLLLLPPTGHELDYLLLADIWPTSWFALDSAGFQPGDVVAVFGAGPVGLLCAYSALLRGASKVYSIDRVPERLAVAKSIGAIPIDFSQEDPVATILASEPKGVDRSCDCVGFECVDKTGKNVTNEVIVNAINVTRNAGGIGLIGVYTPEDDGAPNKEAAKGIIPFPVGTFWFKGLSIKGGVAEIRPLHAPLKALIDSGKAKPSFVFERELKIEDAAEAYRDFSEHKFVKSVIRFGDLDLEVQKNGEKQARKKRKVDV